MKLPTIALARLPDLDNPVGLFGSVQATGTIPVHDDSIIILATFVFEVAPPGGLI